MDDIVYYYPQGHEQHYEPGHPERPERVEAIVSALEANGWWQPYSKLAPLKLPKDVLQTIHSSTYLDLLPRICARGEHYDADTYTTPASWQLALNAAGGAAAVAQAVWLGEACTGFALTRPPGHHATHASAMGFCLLNNIALAAEFLLQQKGASRLAIVDLDLHHGNGTQAAFYARNDVLYISTHQSPFYPGTGWVDEIGSGAGEGATANFPLPPFSGDLAFQTVMQELILPLLDRYRPEMILVSYGFDPHWHDPLGNLSLTAAGYGKLISDLEALAEKHCQGRIALILEGGYSLDAAKVCSLAVTASLLRLQIPELIGKAAGPAPYPEGTAWQAMVRHAKDLWRV